jgi:DNA-binding beta-propeller fold protein YncE
MSPVGGYAASLILNGAGATTKTAFFRHERSYVALLKIVGKTVRKVAQAEVGDLAEGIAFSPDGRFLYVGNFIDGNIDVLRLDSDALTKIASLALPGHPASMRGSTP